MNSARDWLLLVIICGLFVLGSPQLHAQEFAATACTSDRAFIAKLERDMAAKILATWRKAKIHRSSRSARAAAKVVIRQNYVCPRT
jgi:hypothetical protein